jgi:hypothetical protein
MAESEIPFPVLILANLPYCFWSLGEHRNARTLWEKPANFFCVSAVKQDHSGPVTFPLPGSESLSEFFPLVIIMVKSEKNVSVFKVSFI